MEKKCTTCNNELPATTEYFSAQKKGKYGINSKCKKCLKEYRKIYTSTESYKKRHRESMSKWRKENPERSLEISRKNYKINGHKYNDIKKYRSENEPEFRAKIHELAKKYKDSGRRYDINAKPENREKSRIRSQTRRLNPEKKQHDYSQNAKWRENNKEYLHDSNKNYRDNLCDSYIAQTMRISVKNLSPEILETKRLIIKLKRELKTTSYGK